MCTHKIHCFLLFSISIKCNWLSKAKKQGLVGFATYKEVKIYDNNKGFLRFKFYAFCFKNLLLKTIKMSQASTALHQVDNLRPIDSLVEKGDLRLAIQFSQHSRTYTRRTTYLLPHRDHFGNQIKMGEGRLRLTAMNTLHSWWRWYLSRDSQTVAQLICRIDLVFPSGWVTWLAVFPGMSPQLLTYPSHGSILEPHSQRKARSYSTADHHVQPHPTRKTARWCQVAV